MSPARWRVYVRDALLIILGSAVFAVGVDCFEVPNGLAAGGVTGLATVFYALADAAGFYLPVGMQTIVMNVFLLLLVIRSGNRGYIVRTIAGIIACGLFTDALVPVLPVLGNGDLLLCSLWGGVITGIGLGLVFRTGGNTGGTDIVAQLIAKRLGVPLNGVKTAPTAQRDTVIVGLNNAGFTVRQIERYTGIGKSTVSRIVRARARTAMRAGGNVA